MKNTLYILCLLATFAYAQTDKIYQISTIDALLAGYYDGDKKVIDVQEHGDFGLGTFNGIDGEMVVYQGIVYQVKSTGRVLHAKKSLGVPFASVHFFQADKTRLLKNIHSYKQLKVSLDTFSKCQNYPCAFLIEGNFKYIKTRSAPKASKPYPPLAKHIIKTQKIFERKNINGVLIGYKLPAYFAKFNVPGYHFHFLSKDRQFGGHVLGLELKDAKLSLDVLYDIDIALLKTPEFETGKVEVNDADINKVEKGTH
jgi:acetolactate decarboxylase